MNSKQRLLTLSTFGLGATIALAHHIEVGLSHIQGAEILDSVVFYVDNQKFGVPHYRVALSQTDHHATLDFDPGDVFTVSDQTGATETILFEADDFVAGSGGSIDVVHMHDLVAFLNAESNLIEASHENETLVLRGKSGGSSSSLTLQDGSGSPLSTMSLSAGIGFGKDDLDLEVSIPSDSGLDLPGQPYLVVASLTPGSFDLGGGLSLPFAVDALTTSSLKLSASGALPGFFGFLSGTSDASVVLAGSNFAGMQTGQQIYLAYVALTPDLYGIEYVSNSFTISVQ